MNVQYTVTTRAKLNQLPVTNGQLIALADETAYYYDMTNERHLISGVRIVDGLPNSGEAGCVYINVHSSPYGIYVWSTTSSQFLIVSGQYTNGAGLSLVNDNTFKAALLSETKLTNDAAAATETSGRVYPVAIDKSGNLAVNVPWQNNNDKVKQTITSGTDADYRVLLSATADDTTHTEGARKDADLYYNPSTNTMSVKKTSGIMYNNLLIGTGTEGEDKGSGVTPRYFPAKWTFNTGYPLTDGDHITIKIPVAGITYGVYVSIDNGTTYKPVATNGTTRFTTVFPVDNYIDLVYEANASVASIYPLNGGDSSSTVEGGAWRVVNYRDTTYSNRAAAEGGTSTSLCTTGEKYTWNSKADGTHTHATSIATGTKSSIKLQPSTKYTLTAGGSTFAFTTPADSTGGQVTGVKGNAESTYRTGDVNLTPANIGAAASDHTHATSIATGTASSLSLKANTKYTLTAGGSTFAFTTPKDNNSVTGVKGNEETNYRTGQVNLTPANIGASPSTHTHSTSIATGSSSSLSMAANTKYTLTAGGSTFAFTTPSDAVTGVKGNSESSYRTGNVNITKSNIGLSNVPNPSTVSGTLAANATSITLSNSAITTSSNVSIFCSDPMSIYNSCTLSAGKIVLTFDASSSSRTIKAYVF